MYNFILEIARIPFSVNCRFESTQMYFKPYLTEKAPKDFISVEASDLVREQEYLNLEADREKLRRRVFSDPFLERSFIMRQTAHFCLMENILLLHGSTVVVGHCGFLFSADCGVGKSTHTRLWQKYLGDKAYILNDDRAFLSIENGKILAFGSPWTGKHGIGENRSVPLAGICILQRGPENRISSIAADAASLLIEKQFFIPYESDTEKVKSLAAQILSHADLWKMECTKDIQAAAVSYKAMQPKFDA